MSELWRCLDFMGLSLDEYEQPFRARVVEVDGSPSAGSTNGKFLIDPHAHDGPTLELSDTIKGYGIPYTQFKPRFTSFSFETKDDEAGFGHLQVENARPPYSFVLKVRRGNSP